LPLLFGIMGESQGLWMVCCRLPVCERMLDLLLVLLGHLGLPP
jgi:hypothetical protein